GAKFCVECAAPFLRCCSQCGTENPPKAKFCAECATPLTTQPPLQAPLSQDSALRHQHSAAERRQIIVMFCDLVGSTALSAQLDPEDLREVVGAYQETCAEVLQRHEGYIAQYLGDGLLVYFVYPTAHEDDARRAVRAGLEIMEVLRTRGWKPFVSHPLQVRIGIHRCQAGVGGMGAGG